MTLPDEEKRAIDRVYEAWMAWKNREIRATDLAKRVDAAMRHYPGPVRTEYLMNLVNEAEQKVRGKGK